MAPIVETLQRKQTVRGPSLPRGLDYTRGPLSAKEMSVKYSPHSRCVLSQLLPVNAVLGAFILRGDWYTRSDEWVLVEDLKKNSVFANAR